MPVQLRSSPPSPPLQPQRCHLLRPGRQFELQTETFPYSDPVQVLYQLPSATRSASPVWMPPRQEDFLTCRHSPPPSSAGVTLQPRYRRRRPGLDPSTMAALFAVGPLHCSALTREPTKRLLSTQSRCQVPREPERRVVVGGGGGRL